MTDYGGRLQYPYRFFFKKRGDNNILRDFENASPRLNPLFHKPENVSETIIIAYQSLTIL